MLGCLTFVYKTIQFVSSCITKVVMGKNRTFIICILLLSFFFQKEIVMEIVTTMLHLLTILPTFIYQLM